MKVKARRVRVRKGSLTEDLYLQRDGRWGPWKTARVFSDEDAAEKACAKLKITNYGLF
jgi:hypothetical protein